MSERETPAQAKQQQLIEVISIDTLNAIQNNQYIGMLDKKTMVTRDKWKDFGVDIYMFMVEKLQTLGFETILILGYEGTGKSFGIKYLKPGSHIWYNADGKNPTFRHVEYNGQKYKAREVYGTKTAPTKYMVLPKTYQEIIDHVTKLKKLGLLSPNPIAFLTGHLEDYKIEDGETRKRLKTLGSLATKMNIEGSVENCFYTKLESIGDEVKYQLDTQNSGSNTARSLEGAFESRYIDNNFHNIVEAIKNY